MGTVALVCGGRVLAEDAVQDFEVQRALADLPRRQREMTVLRCYGGFDTVEIARALGVSTGTVRTQLHRARHALAVALGETTKGVDGAVRA